MRITVVGGTAGIGNGIALRLAKAGDQVVIGSRKAEKAEKVAGEARELLGSEADVTGAANEEAVSGAEIVVVTVPYPGLADTYKALKPQLDADVTVVDCNVPLASEVGGKPTRMLGIWEGSAAQQAKGILGKGTSVASGFHTVMAAKLIDVKKPLEADVLVCGDSAARKVVRQMVDKIEKARFVNCGPLENARILESLTALLIGINIRYKLDPGAGVRIAGLPDDEGSS
ncbi:MAG TPA: NADPH-dependent F420 reductase [Actinomycetota bacterium]|nr:NADPH-dependent F420 reductase [Actinomycetota bacterium]